MFDYSSVGLDLGSVGLDLGSIGFDFAGYRPISISVSLAPLSCTQRVHTDSPSPTQSPAQTSALLA